MTHDVQLSSSDGEIFNVPRDVVRLSATINTLLHDLGYDDDEGKGQTGPIPLLNVNSANLKLVIKWCTHHKNDEPPKVSTDKSELPTTNISDWDKEFLKIDQAVIFELILASNYLDIKGLLDVTCETIANMIKGKNVEEIRSTFNIKNDFTPEEEEQIRIDNSWCEDQI